MSDPFPIFDSVAALGLLVMLLRGVAQERVIRSIPRVARRVVELVDAGKRDRAIALCDQYPTAVYPSIARRLLLVAERFGRAHEESDIRSRLSEAFASAIAVERRRLHGSRVRDIAVLCFLGGAATYLRYAGSALSNQFYGLCAVGACLIVAGIFSYDRLLVASRKQESPLIEACVRSSRQGATGSLERGRCPTCGRELDADTTGNEPTREPHAQGERNG